MRRAQRSWQIAFLMAAVLSSATCAHQQSTPDVTVMRTGPIYASLPDDCPLTFLNNQHMDILASGYEFLATIIFSGTTGQMEGSASAIPGAVAVGACKLGGDSVSLSNTMATGRAAVLQFAVWRSPPGKVTGKDKPGQPAKAGQQI
jgi:hypothetical protein